MRDRHGRPAGSALRETKCLVRDALLGAILLCSKEVMAVLPNIEPVTMLLLAYTVAYRFRALIPLYLFVTLEAVLYPNISTTLMYLYVWLVPVAVALLLPKRVLPAPVYALIGGLYGLAFGVFCAPAEAWYFGLDFPGTVAWVAAGLPFDLLHAAGNAVLCLLVAPLARLLVKLDETL